MPKTHARYWIEGDLKAKIETIAAKMERSASYVAEKFLTAAVAEFEANLPAPVDSLREKIGKIKK